MCEVLGIRYPENNPGRLRTPPPPVPVGADLRSHGGGAISLLLSGCGGLG